MNAYFDTKRSFFTVKNVTDYVRRRKIRTDLSQHIFYFILCLCLPNGGTQLTLSKYLHLLKNSITLICPLHPFNNLKNCNLYSVYLT